MSDKDNNFAGSSLRSDSGGGDWLAENAGRIIDSIDSSTSTCNGVSDAALNNFWGWRGVIVFVAILLLAAGIYGLVVRYSTMQQEIISLRTSVAAGGNFKKQRDQLQGDVGALLLENQSLRDQVDRLRNQLEVVELYRQLREPEAETPRPPQASVASTIPEPGNIVPIAGWFVNFGSYFSRNIAEEWSRRLDPPAGEVVVTTASLADRTLYRLRIVGLESREEADTIARKLEKDYDLQTLWVGKR